MLTITPVAVTNSPLEPPPIEITYSVKNIPVEEPDNRKVYSKNEIRCLAVNIFHEARNQTIEGMKAVAWVTVNRTKSDRYPDTICGVVYQKKQFSWTITKPVIRNWKVYFEIEALAREFLNELQYQERDPTHGAKFYHANYIKPPKWARVFSRTTQIGDHIFYRREG